MRSTKLLHEVIEARAGIIANRFIDTARRHHVPARSLSREEVLDGLAHYIADLVADLDPARDPSRRTAADAKEHGTQRWYAGYDLQTVLLEYEILRRIIREEAEAGGCPPTLNELDRIAHFFSVGVAIAAMEFHLKDTEALRQAVAAREQVIGVVTHDLLNPIHVVATTATLGLEQIEAGDTDRLRAGLKRIRTSAHGMRRLVDGLLELAKINANESALQLEQHEVRDVVAAAVDAAETAAAEKTIAVDVAAVEGRVLCDRTRLLQVLSNLIHNAIKFSPAGSRIGVSAEHGAREWTFAVRDQGPGIPEEQQARLFQPFWRGQPKQSGVGLGLSIAKSLVEHHGGRIGLESAPGAGSRFWFTIPNTAPAL